MATFFPTAAEGLALLGWLRKHPLIATAAAAATAFGIYQLLQEEEGDKPKPDADTATIPADGADPRIRRRRAHVPGEPFSDAPGRGGAASTTYDARAIGLGDRSGSGSSAGTGARGRSRDPSPTGAGGGLPRNVSWCDQLGGRSLTEVCEPAPQDRVPGTHGRDTRSFGSAGRPPSGLPRASSSLGQTVRPAGTFEADGRAPGEPADWPVSRGPQHSGPSGFSPEWGWYVGAGISPESGEQAAAKAAALHMAAAEPGSRRA